MEDAAALQNEIRKETLDLYNRLHSIDEDIANVNHIRSVYPQFPIIPNLRCGLWYVNPQLTQQGQFAYFKSTDGHYNNWGFNLRRPNLHLLSFIQESRGIILVDSTRSGKKFPDALSKTVPIWCEVLNRAIQIRHSRVFKTHKLYTSASSVSPQEHHQIELKINGWATELAASSYTLPPLPASLRPFWISPSTTVFPSLESQDFIPIICVCASRQITTGIERRSSGYIYVQGSADDHESWSEGLEPDMFWTYRAELMQVSRRELYQLVQSVTSTAKDESTAKSSISFKPSAIAHVNSRIRICALRDMPELPPTQLPGPQSLDDALNDVAYVLIDSDCSSDGGDSVQPASDTTLPILCLRLNEGKRGQDQFLRIVLPSTLPFIGKHLQEGKSVVIACSSGKDASVGVAVAAMQRYFNDDGHYSSCAQIAISKQSIRTRLHWIIASRPEANPSRTTLKRVNEFLLTPARYQA